jgi:hypothetical protein
MRRLAIVVGFFLLLTPVLAAVDLTGKWSGSFLITGPDGETKDAEAFMELKQKGTELTGTAGPNPDKQWPLQKGKVEGNKITFEVQSDDALIKFDLSLAEGHLKGEAKAEHEGQSFKATLDLQRKPDK